MVFDVGKNYIDFFLSKGYQVIALSMPTIGMNNQPIIETSNGFILFNEHSKFYYLEEFEKNPIKLFIEPVIQVLNYIDEFIIIKKYQYGWNIRWRLDNYCKCRLILELKILLVSQGIYRYLLTEHDWGHYELNKSDFYTKFNYLNLYILASSDLNNQEVIFKFLIRMIHAVMGELDGKSMKSN